MRSLTSGANFHPSCETVGMQVLSAEQVNPLPGDVETHFGVHIDAEVLDECRAV